MNAEQIKTELLSIYRGKQLFPNGWMRRDRIIFLRQALDRLQRDGMMMVVCESLRCDEEAAP